MKNMVLPKMATVKTKTALKKTQKTYPQNLLNQKFNPDKPNQSLSIILCKHSSKADIVNQIGFQVCPYIGQNLCGFVVLA